MALDGLFRQRRHAGWNLAIDRHVGDADFLDRRDERPRFPSVAIEKPFPFQRREVLHNRSLAGEAEVMLDLPRARRKTLLALLGLDEFQNASLPLGQHAVIIREKISVASSNEHSVR